VGEINGGIKKVFFVLTRNISWWGNQSLHENVFCLTNKQVGKPFFKRKFFLFHRVKAASGGNLRLFFVLSRNISGWGNQSLSENVFFVSPRNMYKQVGETSF
jgi:hypothetical protein